MSELPTGWTTVALGDVLQSATPGFAYGGHEEDGTFQFRMNNVERNGSLNLDKKRRVPRNAHKKFDGYLLRPDDVLFNATNSPGLIGKTLLVPTFQEPAVYSNHFLRLRPDEQVLDSSFLAKWLQWQFSRGLFEGMTRQWVNQASIKREHLLSVNFPLPPLDEQRRIATILDKVASLLQLTETQLTEIVELPLARLRKEALASSDRVSLKDLLVRVEAGRNLVVQPGQSPHPVNRVLPTGAVTFGTFNSSTTKPVPADYEPPSHHFVREGDLLFGRANTLDLVGATAIASNIPEGTLLPDKIWRLVPDQSQVLPQYLRYAMSLPEIRRALRSVASGTSGSMQNIAQKKLATVKVPVISLHRQREFTSFFQRVEDVHVSVKSRQQQIMALQNSLTSRAFRGEI